MKKVNFSKIKRILIILIAIGIVVVYFIFKNKETTQISQQTETFTPQQTISFNSLDLGVSGKSDVIEKLGEPVEETIQDNTESLEYKSKNPNFNDQYKIEDEKLSFVKQIVTSEDNVTIADIEEKYGIYENVLYGSSSSVGFNLYVYSSKGIAYLGHQKSGIIIEIWYFTPTNLVDFQQKWAPDFTQHYNPVQ